MRRFIAGAVCPECRALDRIVVEEIEGGRRRRCVSCGHTDTLASGSALEPPGRFTRRPEREVPATVVRIVDPPKREP
jgi:uncharacterized metal-binding protein (TIGR02443 family)